MDASMSLSGTADALGVTSFENEACEEVTALGEHYVTSPYTVDQGDLQDLKAYFARPRLAKRGTINFALRTRENVQDINLTTLNTIFPFWSSRLSGVYSIRFTVCARLQVAATAFHQGLLALSWQYNALSTDNSVYIRGSNSASATNLPHVRMDVSELTMVELKVPFMYQAETLTTKSQASDQCSYGHFNVNTILPFYAVAGLSPPTYELYIWLEDVELFGATCHTTVAVALQGGKRVGLAGKEEKDKHLLSNALATGAKVSRFVGKYVPMLASVAGPTAWAADIASGVARYFGYSRPINADPVTKMYPSFYVGETNVDSSFPGFVVGPLQSNTLTFDGVFGGTDVDEMALKYVLGQYCQTCIGLVSTTNNHAQVVYASNVSPNNYSFRAPLTAPYCNLPTLPSGFPAANSFLPTGVCWWASMFRLWRGGLTFRFSFAKTKLHGGRYLVTFEPFVNFNFNLSTDTFAAGPEVSVAGLVQPYGYSMMMDLKDSNEFEFTVPYLAQFPYLQYFDSMGSLTITCIDPLQANATVTSIVPFMVEVKAADDFELACPRGLFFSPHTGAEVINEQSGKVVSATTSPAQHTIGEQIMSVKQLIQMPHWASGIVAANTTYTQLLFPWFYYRVWQAGTPIPNTQGFNGYARVGGAIAQAYVWARGSTDWNVYLSATTNVSAYITQMPNDRGLAPGNFSLVAPFASSATPKVYSSQGTPLHVRIPAYQAFIRMPTWSYSGYDWFVKPGVNGIANTFGVVFMSMLSILKVITSSTANTVVINTAAGDDATLAGYMGPPPMMVPATGNLNPLEPDWT